tara:strand:+ start:3047 stop:3181 length:135 start_codon:yes stop_codon:yes gene_type:complete
MFRKKTKWLNWREFQTLNKDKEFFQTVNNDTEEGFRELTWGHAL